MCKSSACGCNSRRGAPVVLLAVVVAVAAAGLATVIENILLAAALAVFAAGCGFAAWAVRRAYNLSRPARPAAAAPLALAAPPRAIEAPRPPVRVVEGQVVVPAQRQR